MNLRDVIERLAQAGWAIRSHDLGGHDGHEWRLERAESFPLSHADVERLRREGWLAPSGAGSNYVLSDAGRLAFIRSTDEMGDGVLRLPVNESGERNGR